MRIFLFGKTRGIGHLVEDVAADLMLDGHQVRVFGYRENKLEKRLEPWLMSPSLGVPLAVWLKRMVARFQPDILVALGPFHWLPEALFEPLAMLPHRPPLIAWIGDRFDAQAAGAAGWFDLCAYTDSGMVACHHENDFSADALFVPLAASRAQHPPVPRRTVDRLVFVASATEGRRALLANVTQPVSLFGADWRAADGLAHHIRHPRKVRPGTVGQVYAEHLGVLNVRHEHNVLNGLNQRHFAPYIFGRPVVSDAMDDLESCFDIGPEVLVYRDAAELDDVHARLRREPALARAVGEAGQRRVLQQHAYVHRIERMARHLGIAWRSSTAPRRPA